MAKRRDLLKMAGFPAFAAMAAGTPKIPNATLSAEKAKLTRESFGEHRVYFEGATGKLKAMEAGSVLLKAGMAPHPPHEHPDEEFLLITEGTGEVTIEGKPTKVAPGAMMYCAGGRTHGIVNTGKTPLLFYYYKWQ
jgi:mannose-6-phosphate isomerase-like protein (cupin superfamily)